MIETETVSYETDPKRKVPKKREQAKQTKAKETKLRMSNDGGWFIFPSRSEEATLVFPDLDPPTSFQRGVYTTRTIAGIFLPFYVLAIVFIGKTLANTPASANSQDKKRSTLILLQTNLIFSATNILFMILMVTIKLEWNSCAWVGGLGGLFYISANAASYFILLQRANAVNSMNEGPTQKLLFLVKLGSLSVPLVAVLSVFLFSGKHYFTSTTCVQNVDPLISWVFLILDTTLSIGFLLLFLIPLRQHITHMRAHPSSPASESKSSTTSSSRLLAVAKTNMVLSTVAIVSTFVFMMFVSIISQALYKGENPNESAWRLQQYYGSATDLVINSLVSLGITKPVWWRKTKHRSVTQSHSLAGDTINTSLAVRPSHVPDCDDCNI